MKAEDLRIEELVSFSDGALSLKGRRLIIHDMHAFGQFRRDLIGMVNLGYARKALTRFGYYWGYADASAMKRIFDWKRTSDLLQACARLQGIQGVARTRLKISELDEPATRCSAEIYWHGSGEAEEHVEEFGKTDHPVCWTLCGYASGYFSRCLGAQFYFIERSCAAVGGNACMAEGRDKASWGGEIGPFLDYFEIDDIWKKVAALSAELRRKDREIERHKRQIADSAATAKGMVEVRSASFRKVIETASRVARFDTSVLITGESGTGKEVLSRHIHDISARAGRKFVAINCGALPESLLEAELFGYKAGSFTGASKDRDGLFAEADGGTILLDEIGDVSQNMQIKLLRVLQQREILRIGENTPRKINVRIIAATNRDLKRAVEEGAFREDLYYRLAVVNIEIPPLRERRDDIVPLARHFVERYSRKLKIPSLKLDPGCISCLESYAWPGNVRELENAIEHASVFSNDGIILPQNLPGSVRSGKDAPALPANAGTLPLEELERMHIANVLKAAGGNKSKAAKMLGIGAATLWRKLKAAPRVNIQ